MNEILHALFSTQGFVLGTLVPFLFVLTVVVFVHEMGHYLIGRWCGIGVKAYDDVKPGDQIECFERIEVQRTL